MIFSGDLADKVLAGTKTQTRRPAKIASYTPGARNKLDFKPCQYRAGQTYAIQRKRGTHGLGPRIHVLSVDLVPVSNISRRDAKAEGFTGTLAFYDRWREFYGHTSGWCWRIEFKLAEAEDA